MIVDVEMFREWRDSPVASWFFEQMQAEIRMEALSVIGGGVLQVNPGETAQRYAERVGWATGIVFVQEWEPGWK